MMARDTNVPFKGRIQKRKTCHLQIITFGLQRAAGPYRCAKPPSLKMPSMVGTSYASEPQLPPPCVWNCPSSET